MAGAGASVVMTSLIAKTDRNGHVIRKTDHVTQSLYDSAASLYGRVSNCALFLTKDLLPYSLINVLILRLSSLASAYPR